ncbi:MAG: biotin transporter BioY [Propionibacteriaceae bacterium]|jgi:biotin transport system substrate-specific component|nr:biotin transporter BioY [Propionibacteriaceae bacterium]
MNSKNTASDLALVAVFAALTAVCSWISVPLPGGVPITLQTFAVLAAGLILGPWRGFLALMLYLLVGAAGLPVFAGFKAGINLSSPSVGFLLFFPVATLICGALARLVARRGWKGQAIWMGIAAFIGSTFLYIPGLTGMIIINKLEVWAAIAMIPTFLPGDLIKVVLAAAVAVAVRKAFPALLFGHKYRAAAA